MDLFRARDSVKTVLFVCIHNSARSQMAEAFANKLCREDVRASSAGLEPGRLNRLVVQVMSEAGIDISQNATKSVNDPDVAQRSYDFVVTVCDEASAERCPVFPGGGERLHWGFEDPSRFTGTREEILDRLRTLRDAIETRVEEWCRLRSG